MNFNTTNNSLETHSPPQHMKNLGTKWPPSSPPLFNDVIQSVDGFVLLQSLYSVVLVLVQGFLHLLHEGLEVSELLQQRLMGEELNVLCVIVGLVGCTTSIDLLQVGRLVGVYAF